MKMALNSSCRCESCVSLTANVKNVPLTSIRQQLQQDLCQNRARCKAPIRNQHLLSTFKINSTSIVSKAQLNINTQSKAKLKIEPRVTSNFSTAQLNINYQSKRVEQRVQSPGRNFKPIANNLKTFESNRKIVPRTPIIQRSMNLFTTPSGPGQKVPARALKFTPIAKNQRANVSNAQNPSGILVSTIDMDQNPGAEKRILIGQIGSKSSAELDMEKVGSPGMDRKLPATSQESNHTE